MRTAVTRIALGLLALIVALYFGDYLSWRLGFPGHRAPFQSIRVQPYLAVPRKDGKTEFMLDDPVDAPCANSLFPHGGAPPCWYLRRHTSQRKNL